MLILAENLIRIVAKLGPYALIPAGIIAVVLGLFVWLGGLGFRKPLVAVVGAGGGCLCALFFAGKNSSHLAIAAIAGIAVALVLEKIFLTLLAAGLVAIAAIAVSAHLCEVQPNITLEGTLSQLPPQAWLAVAALAAFCILAGFFIWRFVSALACSALGTTLVFTGMIFLLTYKAAEPLKALEARSVIYAGVFGVMTAFGIVVQLLLCPGLRKMKPTKIESKKQGPNAEPEGEQKHLNWRMH
jgi:hypothetical protein